MKNCQKTDLAISPNVFNKSWLYINLDIYAQILSIESWLNILDAQLKTSLITTGFASSKDLTVMKEVAKFYGPAKLLARAFGINKFFTGKKLEMSEIILTFSSQ